MCVSIVGVLSGDISDVGTSDWMKMDGLNVEPRTVRG